MARFCAVGAGRMGRGIAMAFAYAGHRITLVDLRQRTPEAWAALQAEVQAELRASAQGLAALGALPARLVEPLLQRIVLVPAGQAPAA